MVYILCFFFASSMVACLHWAMPRNGVCLSLAVFLATFAALRGPDVASDFMVYQDWYTHRDAETGFLERPGYFEAFYFLWNDAFAALAIPFRIFIGYLAFVAVFLKTKVVLDFARHAWAAAAAVLVYAFTFYLLHEFTQVRAGLAVAFMFVAVQALVHGKRTAFIAWVLVATGFHSSAVMALTLLLPYHGRHARWLDRGLLGLTGGVYALSALGVNPGVLLMDMLSAFDPRVALYISMAESGHSDAANPFSASAMLLLALMLCLAGVSDDTRQLSGLDRHEVKAVVLIRRSVLIGLNCLALFSPIPELALRLFEINIALLPILVAIVFSQPGWLLQKFLLIAWAAALAAIYIGREEGLVKPYALFFT